MFSMPCINQRSQNAQPSPKVAISGVWGIGTNKRFRGFTGYGKSAKISKLTEVCIACQLVNRKRLIFSSIYAILIMYVYVQAQKCRTK